MKYLLPTFVFCFIFNLSFAQTSWKTLNIPDAGRYDDISFIDNNTGWAAGGPSHKVFKTSDGGQTWQQAALLDKYLRSIEFLDENTGFCGSFAFASNDPNVPSESSLYKTTDGGLTWTDIMPDIKASLPEGLAVSFAGICGLRKADENTLYAVGVWQEPAYLLKSTDKGLTWTYKDMSEYASSLIDIYFFDANKGFVTGSRVGENSGGVILYTEDGGATWIEKINTGLQSDRVWKIQTPDGQNFYGSIERLIEQGPTRIVKSTDKGMNWEVVTVNPSYHYCQMVGFLDDKLGWTGGRESLFETKDGGATWKRIYMGSTYNRFLKLDNDHALLTGKRVYKYTRQVVTANEKSEPYDPIHTIEISPNPTSGITKARVKFGVATFADINVYGLKGEPLKNLYHGLVNAGVKEFEINVSNASSQTFIFVVKTNEGQESIKFIKR